MGYLARPSLPRAGVHNVSSAPQSPRQDQRRRLRGYLIAMGIRTCAFGAAGVALIGYHSTTGALVAAAMAVVLPYPAVVLANATDRRQGPAVQVADDLHHLGAGATTRQSPTSGDAAG